MGWQAKAITHWHKATNERKVRVKKLDRMGYRPDAAARWPGGLPILPPGLRLGSSIRMPEMDSITAYTLEGDSDKCLEASMDDYINNHVSNLLVNSCGGPVPRTGWRSFLFDDDDLLD